VKGSKRGKANRVQQFSIYTRVRDPQARERGLCIPLGLSSRPPTLAPLPSDPGDATGLAYIQEPRIERNELK